jgi:exportin-1
MIQNDFVQFPEFRLGFFKLVHSIILYCTQGLLELDPGSFNSIIESVVFGIKHEMPELMEVSLKSVWDLNDSILQVGEVSVLFYTQFFTKLFREVVYVMTDCRHLSGFKLQCKILQQLIYIIETGAISQPLCNVEGQPHTMQDNKTYTLNLILNTIMEKFPNLNHVQVETLAMQLFNNVDNWKEFKSTIRDLMVSMRSFSSSDDAFYEHERKVSSI